MQTQQSQTFVVFKWKHSLLQYVFKVVLCYPCLNKCWSDLMHHGKHINFPWLCAWYNKALSQGFRLLCAAVRFHCFLYFVPHIPLLFLSPLILQQTSNVSATLVLTRPIRGPKEVILDLEMVTVNNVINFRGSSIIRLTIFVSEHPFWVSQTNVISPEKSYCTHLLLI